MSTHPYNLLDLSISGMSGAFQSRCPDHPRDMGHETIRSIGAVTAIAAVLALGSTSANAQDAASTIALPPTVEAPPGAPEAPPAAAVVRQPTIVLPTMNETAGQSATPAERIAPLQPRAASRPAAQPRERSAVSGSAAVPAPVAQAAAPEPVAPIPAPPLAAEPAAADARPAVAENSPAGDPGTGFGVEASLAALLGAVGFIGAALLMRSRRRRKSDRADAAYEALPPASSSAMRPVKVEPAEVSDPTPVSYAFYDTKAPLEPGDGQRRMAPPVIVEGEVPTGDAREELLRRMVEAEPDASNPFTSRKARRRRARLILQSREQGEAAPHDGKEPFDWRSYRSSAQNAPLHTPRVTA